MFNPTYDIEPFIISALVGYLIGSIPFGLVLSKLFGYGDIRKIGSGNIGATNVLRTGNKLLAALTLLLDATKGVFVVYPLAFLGITACDLSCPSNFACAHCSLVPLFAITGFFAILGHMFPIYLKFKGGKGVATTLGVLLAAVPYVGLAACIIWLLMAVTFRYSSLAALVAIVATPPLAYIIYEEPTLTGFCAIITLLVWFKHRANIQRLVAGEEPKIGKGK